MKTPDSCLAEPAKFPLPDGSEAIREIISHIPAGVCVFAGRGAESRCTAANARVAEIIGWDADELAGKSFEDFLPIVHPDDAARCRADMTVTLRKLRSASGTYRIYNRRRQTYDWVRLEGMLTPRPDGSEQACFACSNVNGAQSTEQALDQSREALRSVMQYVPGGVFVYSAEPDEQFTLVSDNMLAMLGYTRAEFDEKFGGRFSLMVYAEDRERVLKEIWEQIAVGPFDTCIYRIEKKDGSLLWVHDEGHIVSDAQGKRWFYVVIVDITASVQAKDDLVSQNHELRRIIDTIPARVIVYRMQRGELRIVAANGYLNERAKIKSDRLLMLTRDEIRALICPEDREKVAAFYGRLFSGEKTADEMTYRTTIDELDDFRWYHCSAISRAQEDGSVLLYAVYTDATLQKQREEEFNRIIQELLTANPNSLCAFRLNLTRNLCSDGHGASGYILQLLDAATADELLEKIAAIITDPADAERFRREFSRDKLLERFRAGEERASMTYHRLTDNGAPHWVTTYFHILRNPFTDEIEAIAYSMDSDEERKRQEIVSAITGGEYDYIGLIDRSTGAVSYYYVSGRETVPKSDMPQSYSETVRMVSMFMPSEQERRQYLASASLETILAELEEKPSYMFSHSCLTAGGETRRKQVSFRYLENNRKEIMFALADITNAFAREEAYMQQLRQALQSAERANEMKSDFLGSVSHDMRTPLNAILGYDLLALRTDDPAAKDDFLRKIGTAGSTLLSLINDTLDLQKIENGSTELKMAPASCGEVIREIVTSVRPLMEQKHIAFTVENSRAVMATINTDLVRLREIFLNLLSNAAKFTPEGGHVELIVECVGLEKNRVHDRITVRDDGIGMSREFQEKMFEPFSQERTRETAHIGGSGLGLTIAKRLVERMGGRIEVGSEPGKGSEFMVYLDFERLDDKLAGDGGETEAPVDICGRRVLLCEDNEMNTEIATRILEMYGAEVVSAADGAEGAQRFAASAEDEFDIVLMDIRMPVMDGYTAAARIRKSGHPRAGTVPILAMTADAYESDVSRALEAGMNGHVSKPIDPRRLAAEIARLTAEEKESRA